jgi:enoyl-CoA hydratase
MVFDTISLEVDDAVALLTLNRPQRMNALSVRLKQELDQAIDMVAGSPDIRVLLLTGAGDKAFCAGADIKERAAGEASPAAFLASQRRTHALFSRLESLPQPTIALINGVALGGGLEIALCCDMRIASASARFGLTEVNLGIIPAGGGTQRLPRLIGTGRAKRMIFAAQQIAAGEALGFGLVDEVVAASALLKRGRAIAAEIAAKPPLALRFAKSVVDGGMRTDVASGLELELQAASILFGSEDRKEGMEAFLAKRAPVFKGR